MTSTSPNPPARFRVWIALLAPPFILAAVFTPFGMYFSTVHGLQGDDVVRAIERIAVFPTTIAFVLVFLLTRLLATRDGFTWRDLGWTPPTPADVGIAVGAALGLGALNAHVLYPLVQSAQPGFDPTLAVASLPSVLATMGVAVMAEDSLYRGYAFRVLRERHGTIAAVAITTLCYAPLAGAQGFPLVLWATWFGVVLCGLRLWRGNLWTVMLTHFLVSVGPKVLAQL